MDGDASKGDNDTAADPPSLPGLDMALVGGWIEGLGIGGPLAASPLGDGKSNLTYLIAAAGGGELVLRRPPLGPLLPSAHDMRREHRILRSLAGTPVPAPQPVALREPDREIDVPLLLMERVEGCVVDSDRVLATIAPASRRAIGLSLAQTLARIHAVDLAAVGLDDLGSHEPYAERQLKRWSRQYEESQTRDLPLVGKLAERLRAAIPAQREVTLVHGDFHLANVITDPVEGSVRAVIDWELSTLGDPLADLGGLLAYWPEADDPVPPAPNVLPAEPGFPSRRELVAAYESAAGRTADSVGFWEALGCWKVAIISEGVLKRSLDEPANGDAEGAALTTELMLQRAAYAAERAGI